MDNLSLQYDDLDPQEVAADVSPVLLSTPWKSSPGRNPLTKRSISCRSSMAESAPRSAAVVARPLLRRPSFLECTAAAEVKRKIFCCLFCCQRDDDVC